jgi:hypothetical protein
MIARIRRMHNMKYSKDGSAMSMANFGHIQSKYLDIKPTDIIHDKSEIKNSKQINSDIQNLNITNDLGGKFVKKSKSTLPTYPPAALITHSNIFSM